MPRKKKIDDQAAAAAAAAPEKEKKALPQVTAQEANEKLQAAVNKAFADPSTVQPAAASKSSPRARIFNCLQYEVNPKTGVSLNFDENNILRCVAHKSIARWAYILHDKDVVTEYDIETGKGLYTDADLGKSKGKHWHVVLEFESAMPLATVAKWLGIPEQFIEIPKGRSAFIDCVEYLCHSDVRQALKGKYDYDPSEVKANFEWEIEVQKMVLRKTKYEKPLSEEEFVMNEVLYSGLPLREVKEKYPTLYRQKLQVFKNLRGEYILDNAPLPPFRLNFYIEGDTGYGKDTMARAIARSLFKDLSDDREIYFEIGDNKVKFDDYDGQPVIIWSEYRSDKFMRAFEGDYSEILKTFDIIPKDKRDHVKFNKTKLINMVNIVTASEPFEEFQKNIIPPKDPAQDQLKRRMPVWIKIHPEDFDIAINAGYIDKNNFEEYMTWKNIKGSFRLLASRLSQHQELQKQISDQMVAPVIDITQQVKEKIAPDPYKDMTDDEILKDFADYGSAQDLNEVNQDRVWSLSEEYTSWLVDEFFVQHPTAATNRNYPTFKWWLEHEKHISQTKVLNPDQITFDDIS